MCMVPEPMIIENVPLRMSNNQPIQCKMAPAQLDPSSIFDEQNTSNNTSLNDLSQNNN